MHTDSIPSQGNRAATQPLILAKASCQLLDGIQSRNGQSVLDLPHLPHQPILYTVITINGNLRWAELEHIQEIRASSRIAARGCGQAL